MKTFDSLDAFGDHLARTAQQELLVQRKALQKSAALIKKSAKDEIGHLQPQVGPFNAWKELSDYTKKDKDKQGYHFNDDYNPLLRDGTLRDSYEYRTTPFEAVIGSKMDIANWQEFGTSRNGKEHIPARPVLGPAAFKNKNKIKEIIAGEFLFDLFRVGKKVEVQDL